MVKNDVVDVRDVVSVICVNDQLEVSEFGRHRADFELRLANDPRYKKGVPFVETGAVFAHIQSN